MKSVNSPDLPRNELDFLGGTKKPDFGKGNWLERMRGKPSFVARE